MAFLRDSLLRDLPLAVPLQEFPQSEKVTRARIVKPAPPPPPTKADTRAADIARLQTDALEAYKKGSYVEPPGESAIEYSKQVLALHPGDEWAIDLINRSVTAVKWEVRQAIQSKDFGTAHRKTNALRQLLPNHADDVAELEEDIAKAESPKPVAALPAAPPVIQIQVRHLHADKTYCRGTLSVSGHQMKFVGESTTGGQAHQLTFACSGILDINRDRELFSHHGTFHVKMASGNNKFVPEDASNFDISALKSACKK
jgi:hypothetical protein